MRSNYSSALFSVIFVSLLLLGCISSQPPETDKLSTVQAEEVQGIGEPTETITKIINEDIKTWKFIENITGRWPLGSQVIIHSADYSNRTSMIRVTINEHPSSTQAKDKFESLDLNPTYIEKGILEVLLKTSGTNKYYVSRVTIGKSVPISRWHSSEYRIAIKSLTEPYPEVSGELLEAYLELYPSSIE